MRIPLLLYYLYSFPSYCSAGIPLLIFILIAYHAVNSGAQMFNMVTQFIYTQFMMR